MVKTEETRLVPLLWWLKPYFLLAVFSLHGGSLKTAEQQPVGKIPQVRWGQVTRLFLQEVADNIHRYIWRRAIHCPATTQIYNLQIWALMLMVNVFVYLSYKAQFLLWGQYWQVCLLVRMSGSRDNRLFSPRVSTQLRMWWIKVFLSFSNSDRRIYRVLWRLPVISCGQYLSARVPLQSTRLATTGWRFPVLRYSRKPASGMYRSKLIRV